MKRDVLETRELKFGDSVELIVERRGEEVVLAQKVWVEGNDGRETMEEWELADGEIEGYFPDLI